MSVRVPKYRHHKGSGQALVQISTKIASASGSQYPLRTSSVTTAVKRFSQFRLRSLFWAITCWSVLVVVFTRLGLVEALEAVLALTALLVLATWFHREFPPRIQH